MQRSFGFIGGVGHHYLQQAVAEGDRVAVASDGKDAGAARRWFEGMQKRFPSAQWFDDGETMLDTFKPDLLSVGSVYGYAGDWNAAGLRRGIKVVSDKPIAATWQQLDVLEKLVADDSSRVLLTEFDFRCRADFRAAKAVVDDGTIGDVVLVTAQKSYRFGSRPAWYADRQSYSGTLLWIASHAIDVIGFTTGKAFESLTGAGGNISRPEMGTFEDHVVMLGTLAGGGTAVAHADFLRPRATETHGDDRLRIAGSKGIVEVRDYRAVLMTHDQPAIDITDRVQGASVGGELLMAAVEGNAMYYSTQKSLATARLLLRARDAGDERQWLAV